MRPTSEQRVVLRADAGSRIGFGHYVRTVALAGYLSAAGFKCVIATRNPDGGCASAYQAALAAEAGAELLPLRGGERAEFDPQFLSVLRTDDIVVLDNYYFETAYQRAVRERCRALVCIDDMHDRHFVADVVMTFCPLTRADFSLEPYTRFYGGIEWSFLREPFLRPPVARSAGTVRRVAMAMGGADPFRLTDKMIALLREVVPSVEIDVLAGQTVQVVASADERLRIWRQADAATIADIFDRVDMGIFPASTVCVEAFARRLPVAAGYYVDNQEDFYAHGVGEGWFAPLGCLLDAPSLLLPRLAAALPAPPAVPAFDFAAQRAAITHLFTHL